MNRNAARRRLNRAIKAGRVPHPTSLPCTDCADVQHRHVYHHLDDTNLLIVEPVCDRCFAYRMEAMRRLARASQRPVLTHLEDLVRNRAAVERAISVEVARLRGAGHEWTAIAPVLGVRAEVAKRRYAVESLEPLKRAV